MVGIPPVVIMSLILFYLWLRSVQSFRLCKCKFPLYSSSIFLLAYGLLMVDLCMYMYLLSVVSIILWVGYGAVYHHAFRCTQYLFPVCIVIECRTYSFCANARIELAIYIYHPIMRFCGTSNRHSCSVA